MKEFELKGKTPRKDCEIIHEEGIKDLPTMKIKKDDQSPIQMPKVEDPKLRKILHQIAPRA